MKPNKETQQAIYEAHNNIRLTEIKELDTFFSELKPDCLEGGGNLIEGVT